MHRESADLPGMEVLRINIGNRRGIMGACIIKTRLSHPPSSHPTLSLRIPPSLLSQHGEHTTIHYSHIYLTDNVPAQPTEFELRRKNAQFESKVRAGKTGVKPSRQERLAKRSPISLWALGIILFVVVGGGTLWRIISGCALSNPCCTVLFELLRVIFL